MDQRDKFLPYVVKAIGVIQLLVGIVAALFGPPLLLILGLLFYSRKQFANAD
jgi:hypothetical protein